jgi:DNA invertase Pin-like site-specific DNA recombinase
MRAVIYPRVSSLIQRDQHTIASQLHDLPLYIERRGWDLVRSPDYYIDDGRSAKTGKLGQRLNFLRLLEDAGRSPRPFDVVVVIDAKRVTRTESWRERGLILGVLQDAGIKIAIASTDQVLDLNTDEGDLLIGLETHFAAKDNRSRRESILRGKDTAIRRGRKPAGPTPFGYLYDRATGAWSVDPELGPIVIEIFERVAGGESCETIARNLQARGVPRARPSKNRRRQPGRWNRERVHQIARAATYRGTWTANKSKGLSVAVPRIIGDDLYSVVDEALSRRGRRGEARVRHVYLAQGIARCAICGALIGCGSTSPPGPSRQRVFYYWCTRRRRPIDGERCRLRMRRVEEVDSLLWDKLSEALARPDIVRQALAESQPTESGGTLEAAAELAAAEREVARMTEVDSIVVERFTRGLIPSAVMDSHLERSTRERTALERKMSRLRGQLSARGLAEASVTALETSVARLRQRLASASLPERRGIVRTLIPGRGDNWVVLGSDAMNATVLLAAQPAPSTSATSFAQVDAAG